MNDKTQENALKHIAGWGRQTITFAMSLHAENLGKPIDDPTRVVGAGSETYRIAEEL